MTAESTARADFQLYQTTVSTASLPLTPTDWGPTTKFASGSNPFTIQQFDASKYSTSTQTAHLYQVTVNLDYDFKNSISMTFANKATMTVTAQGIMHLNVLNPNGSVAIADVVTAPTFWTQMTLAYPTQISNPVYIQSVPKDVKYNSAWGYQDQSTLNLFSGTNTVALPVYASATSGYNSTSGNGFGSSTTTASAGLAVTYYYYFTPVPEPSSFVLIGLGGLGLFAASRAGVRRKDRAAA